MRNNPTFFRPILSSMAVLSVFSSVALANTPPGTNIVNVASAEHSDRPAPGAGTVRIESNVVVTPVVAPASLIVVKSAEPSGAVAPGTSLTFRLLAENPSPMTLTGAIVTDVLDPLLASPTSVTDLFVRDDGPGGAMIPVSASWDPVTRTLRWDIPKVPASARFELSFVATVDSKAPEDSVVRNVSEQLSDQDPAGTRSNEVVVGVVSPSLTVAKRASRSRVEVGGLVGYRVEVRNISATLPLAGVEVVDRLPKHFRLLEGSTRLDGRSIADPQGSGKGGRDLVLLAGDLSPGESRILTYVAVPTAPAEGHDGINEAWATAATPTGTGLSAGPAQATVRVEGSLMSGDAVVVGRVFVDDNRNGIFDEGEVGVPSARVYLEDGSYTLTDVVGKYHFEGVRPGLHVMKLDPLSMPEGIGAFASWSRSAGGAGTQFVDAAADQLFKTNVATGGWGISIARLEARATYRNAREEDRTVRFPPLLASAVFGPATTELSLKSRSVVHGYAALIREHGGRMVQLEVVPSYYPLSEEPLMLARALRLRDELAKVALASAAPAAGGDAGPPVSISLAPPRGSRSGPAGGGETAGGAEAAVQPGPTEMASLEDRVRAMTADPEVLLPLESEPLRGEKANVEVKLPAGLTPRVTVNGAEIPADLLAVRMETSGTNLLFFRYVGVAFREGRNALVLEGVDPWGNARVWVERTIDRVGPPADITVECADEAATADGRTPTEIRVTVRDALGLPVADGTIVTLETDEGGFAGNDASPRQEGFQVATRDGSAIALLEPADRSVNRRIMARIGDLEGRATVSLAPELRNWILAGVGEATVGHRGATDGDPVGDLLDQDGGAAGRLAVFARGRLFSASTMTLAYDSGRERDRDQVFRRLAPDRFFPIYGDSSRQGYEVEGQSKFSLRLDQPRSSFTVGDFVTGLSGGDLLRYDRALTGGSGRVDLKGFSIQSFGATTPQSQVRDELPGEGVSGPYRLSRRPLIVNSERILIETRDRFHTERVRSSMELSRFSDYDIDYENGTVLFKKPVAFQDDDFNPMIVVALYETLDGGGDQVVAGGRAAYRFGETAEIGTTYVDEARDGGDFVLRGADFKVQRTFAGGSMEFGGEAATTESGERDPSGAVSFRAGGTIGASVGLSAYYRNVASGFSNLSRAGLADAGSVRWGIEGKAKVGGASRIGGEVYAQSDSLGVRDRRVASLEWETKVGRVVARSGLKDLRAFQSSTGTMEASRLVTAGASLRLSEKIDAQVGRQQVVRGAAVAEFPTRTSLGLNYRITGDVRGFLRQEIDRFDGGGASRTVLGFESRLASHTIMESRYSLEDALAGERGSAQMGIRTRLPLSQDWLGDAAVERVVATHGSSAGDFTSLGVGFEYLPARVKFTSRYELRLGEQDDRHVVTAAGATRITDALSLFTRQRIFFVSPDRGGARFDGDGLLGLAYRPVSSDRLNFLVKLQGLKGDGALGAGSPQARSFLGIFETNYEPIARLHLLGRLAMKRNEDVFDGDSFTTTSRLTEIRLLYDVTDRFNAGVNGRILDQLTTSTRLSGYGIEAGYSLVRDLWLVGGYNVTGFSESGFGDADRRNAGPFLSVRFKFDEESAVGLARLMGRGGAGPEKASER